MAGVPISYDHASTGGVVWQLMANLKTEKASVIAVGERYDTMLLEYQNQAQNCKSNNQTRKISGAGLSFSLDKVVAAIGNEFDRECRGIDVAICISEEYPSLKEVTQILNSLWSADIRSGFVDAVNKDDALELAEDLGAIHVIFLTDDGYLLGSSRNGKRHQEKKITRAELIPYIQKMLENDNYALSTSLSNISIKSALHSTNNNINPRVTIDFLNSTYQQKRQENLVR